MKIKLILISFLGFGINMSCAKPYVETKADIACYEEVNYSFQGSADCIYNQADKVQADIKEKIKKLNKQNLYSDQWLKDSRTKIEKNCKTKFYRDGDYMTYTETAQCVRDSLSALIDKVK